jgi:hypothetical protein
VTNKEGKLFFVYGSGGIGITFVWTTLLSHLWGQGKIVLVVASSGIASLLLLGNKTTHSRFRLIYTMNRLTTSHNRWKWLSSCVKLIWSFGMTHRWCIVELSKLLIGHCVIWCNWMMHKQPRKSLVGKPWSLVGILDRSCLLFPREDEKTLLVLHCLDCIFGSMLWIFVFISTCESW